MTSESVTEKIEKLNGNKIEVLKQVNQLMEDNLKVQKANLELKRKKLNL